MIMILCGTYGMMTKIFCSICGARLRIMGEPVLSETEDSYMVDDGGRATRLSIYTNKR